MKTRVPPDVLIPVNEVDTAELDRMFRFTARAGANPQGVNAWLLYLGSQNLQLTTTLLEEMRRMTTNDDQLTQAVQDLLDAYAANTTALEAEVAAMQAKGLDGADPVITTSVTKIEGIVAQMKQATAAAQAAIQPATVAAASSGPDTAAGSGTQSSGSTAGSSPTTAAG